MKFQKQRSAYKVSAQRKSRDGAAAESQRGTDKQKFEKRYVTREISKILF